MYTDISGGGATQLLHTAVDIDLHHLGLPFMDSENFKPHLCGSVEHADAKKHVISDCTEDLLFNSKILLQELVNLFVACGDLLS